MVRKIVRWVNYFLIVCLACLTLLALMKLFHQGGTVSEEALEEASTSFNVLPKNLFQLSQEAYNDIGSPVLSVVLVAPKVELPDLRPFLVYYGVNDRPDMAKTATTLHFGVRGSDAMASIAPGERLYLKYDNSKKPGIYVFSPDNAATSLWIEAQKDANKANIKVGMEDEAGNAITEPAMRATFILTASPFMRAGGIGWEIGKWKVDGTLLARQRARWLGQDVFLTRHGGEEFSEFKDKDRIEFGEGNDRYSIYVKIGDCLIWDGQKWQNVRLGESSHSFPLMCVTKIDDRVMTLDLWDVGGQGHVVLNLIKSKEAWTPKTLEADFKFISTRTLSQYVFEIKKERTTLHPFDWLLLVDKNWVPLSTEEEIDNYVDRNSQGPLYVFLGPAQKDDGKQVLRALIYSPGRTEIDEVEYPLDQPVLGGFPAEAPPAEPKERVEEQKQEEVPPIPFQDESKENTNGQDATENSSNTEEERYERPDDSEIPELEGIPARGAEPEIVLRDRDPQRSFSEQERQPISGSGALIDEQLQRSDSPMVDMNSASGEVVEVIIRPKIKKRPGQLRDDIRFLLQDNGQ